jgi:hypothetical protein
MKKVILNCAVDGSAVPALCSKRPLVLAPFLGATVLEHALAALAASGVKRVQLKLAGHEKDILRIVGGGEAWGLQVEVAGNGSPNEGFRDARTATLETLPQLPDLWLWRSYRAWYGAQLELLPLLAQQRVGMRQIAKDIFVGLRSQVAPNSRLVGPCWIGANVFIGSDAVIGPGTVVEDGCYIEDGAEVTGSLIGPETYVGKVTEVRNSFACGSDLLHLDTGSLTEVADGFLLGSLRQPVAGLGHFARALRRTFGRAANMEREAGRQPVAPRRAGGLQPAPAN